MKHDVLLGGEATLVERSSSLVVWDLADSLPGPISLGLTLLTEALVEEVVLRPATGLWALRLRGSGEPRDILLRRCDNAGLEMALGRIALEALLVFFLKYYRDGRADVDHLDMEATWDTGNACDVTLKVSRYKPPVSAEEARKRLGLDPL
jgi:hypothetical protein